MTTEYLTEADYLKYGNAQFDQLGHWYSSANDLSFLYGAVKVEGVPGNHVQLWVQEKAWKLAVFAAN